MSMSGTYALITPARNEADNLRRLAPCLAAQTVKPAAWIVVDDGSSDQTLEVARDFGADHPWVSVLSSPGAISRSGPLDSGRNSGRDILAFHAGLEALDRPVDFVVKLDADVAFAPDYFECLLQKFAEDPRLGIAGGVCYEFERGDWHPRHVTRGHVRGATRMWRWACLQQLLPLEDRLGWDSLDELKARVLAGAHKAFPTSGSSTTAPWVRVTVRVSRGPARAWRRTTSTIASRISCFAPSTRRVATGRRSR